jgi:hypothetical protein
MQEIGPAASIYSRKPRQLRTSSQQAHTVKADPNTLMRVTVRHSRGTATSSLPTLTCTTDLVMSDYASARCRQPSVAK